MPQTGYGIIADDSTVNISYKDINRYKLDIKKIITFIISWLVNNNMN